MAKRINFFATRNDMIFIYEHSKLFMKLYISFMDDDNRSM